ncbi:MAG TPA: hypothetical protein VGG79_00810 [Roseiarcus sp.]|jgi:hypothetical protein
MIAWINGASALFAFIAAVLWTLSAKVDVPSKFPILIMTSHFADPEMPAVGEVHSIGSSDQIDDLAKAVIKQSRFSAYAAISAGAAAFCQMIGFLVQLHSN